MTKTDVVESAMTKCLTPANKAVNALSAEGAVEATAAVGGQSGIRLNFAEITLIDRIHHTIFSSFHRIFLEIVFLQLSPRKFLSIFLLDFSRVLSNSLDCFWVRSYLLSLKFLIFGD